LLPADAREWDYVEFGLVGAYGRTMRAGFNGFGEFDEAFLADAPFRAAGAPGEPARRAELATAASA
ncbi:MAG: hypothetical protein MI723_06570, partial [Caulobacterales bacterium]|nr:hypothetical protein [Caulobacterales bacterium]